MELPNTQKARCPGSLESEILRFKEYLEKKFEVDDYNEQDP